MSIKISVIVPIYKVEKEIERCLASVLSQDYGNIELILVNDYTPDKSFDIAMAYLENTSAKIDVKLIEQPYNQGLSIARNTALATATGDYIFYLDSDDEIASPDVLSYLANLVTRQKTAPDLILGGYYRVDDLGLAEQHGINRYILSNNDDVLRAYAEQRFWPTAHVKLLRRDFLELNNIDFKSGLYHEDELWFFHVVQKAKTVIGTPKMIYNYYWARDGSITSSVTDKHIQDMTTVVLEMYQAYQKDPNYHPVEMAMIIERFRRRALKMLIQFGSKGTFMTEQLSRLQSISLSAFASKNSQYMRQNLLLRMPPNFVMRYLCWKWRK